MATTTTTRRSPPTTRGLTSPARVWTGSRRRAATRTHCRGSTCWTGTATPSPPSWRAGCVGEAPATTSAPPLVSAVIIFLNGERFIGEAIESVLAQTYTNWELLLVDDGSTDGATAIAKGYAGRF